MNAYFQNLKYFAFIICFVRYRNLILFFRYPVLNFYFTLVNINLNLIKINSSCISKKIISSNESLLPTDVLVKILNIKTWTFTFLMYGFLISNVSNVMQFNADIFFKMR